MVTKKLSTIASLINGYSFKSSLYKNEGLRVIRIANVQDGFITDEYPCFYPSEYINKIGYANLQENDLLMSLTGNVGRVAFITKDLLPAGLNQRVICIRTNSNRLKEYLYYFFRNTKFKKDAENNATGIAQLNLSAKWLSDYEIPIYDEETTLKITSSLKSIDNLIKIEKEKIAYFEELIKSRFIEMFGEIEKNTNQYPILKFTEVAKIDCKMIHNFKNYQDYPHIGIDCIEKDTGKILSYNTIGEDGVISGKYLFDARHIIYSKIRPNLNKVAIPDFTGLCSADSYPILAKEQVCNRIFLAYILRSDYFLRYILPFSNRANMPKVNKDQLNGFSFPVPPIELQNKFAKFVELTDKLKFSE